MAWEADAGVRGCKLPAEALPSLPQWMQQHTHFRHSCTRGEGERTGDCGKVITTTIEVDSTLGQMDQ